MEFFQQTLIEAFGQQITIGEVFTFVFWCILLFALSYIITKRLLPKYFEGQDIDPRWRKRIVVTVRRVFYPLVLVAFLTSLGFDAILYRSSEFTFTISTLLFGIVVIQLARLLDWYTSKVLMHYYTTRETRADRASSSPAPTEEKASRTVQYIVYTIAAMVLIGTFDLNLTLVEVPLGGATFPLRVSSFFMVVLVFLVARLFSWVVTQLILFSYYRKNEVDPGRRYAVNQLVTYFIYVIAIFVMVDNTGIDLTVLWGGFAALLVGIGLGMQDIFKDFISGIILLSERSVEVNDVVNVNGTVGKIRKIGLRTSLMLGRDDTMLIVPNSSLISNNVMNWTHLDRRVRFSIKVGVAYGTDTALTKNLLLKTAVDNPRVLTYPAPFVRFTDFGDSSLDFELFFWSEELMGIENVRSEMRFAVNDIFLENQINIPFPQRDVWLRKQ